MGTARKRRGSAVAAKVRRLKKRVRGRGLWGLFRRPRGKLPEGFEGEKMIATALELLKKYDVPGPRYTSYPTVLYWDRNPTAEEWVASLGAQLDEAEASGEGAAVYVHIPFCR